MPDCVMQPEYTMCGGAAMIGYRDVDALSDIIKTLKELGGRSADC